MLGAVRKSKRNDLIRSEVSSTDIFHVGKDPGKATAAVLEFSRAVSAILASADPR